MMAQIRLIFMLLVIAFAGGCAEGPTVAPDGPCPLEVCLNDGQCEMVSDRQLCVCPDGFYGDLCENEGTPPSCADDPCQNGGSCTDGENGGYACDCPAGYIGDNCEEKSATGPCFPNPCLNGGACEPAADGTYVCECLDGYSGQNCEENVVDPGACSPNPCLNDGTCEETEDGSYFCVCPDGFTGDLCESKMTQGPCDDEPCQNGGTCAETEDGYECACPDGYTGDNCEEVVIPDPCDPNPCQNEGTCVGLDGGGFQCECMEGFSGEFCETPDPVESCDPNPCQNGGECSLSEDGLTTCACPEGYSGELCEVNDACAECTAPTPGCLIGPEGAVECVSCTEDAHCGDDELCDQESNTCVPASGPCADNPCENGGVCGVSEFGASPGCLQPEGDDQFCSEGCKEAVCAIDPFCCLFGWDETCANCAAGGEDFAGNDCSSVGNLCTGGETYVCECPDGTTGANCETIVVDPCEGVKCQNEGICVAQDDEGYVCECPDGFSGQFCEYVAGGPCDPNPCVNGLCTEGEEDVYLCECPEGWYGVNCEKEYVDPCEDNPCANEGTCGAVDIALCQEGCDDDLCRAAVCEYDPFCCNAWDGFCASCAAGGAGFDGVECTDVTVACQGVGFECSCVEGFSGDTCEIEPPGPCADNPCQNGGECSETDDGYSCECKEGYSGDNCEEGPPYDPCDPNPCQNDGQCEPTEPEDGKDYACVCVNGYSGVICDIPPADPCDPNPCENGGTCVGDGDAASCECIDGYSGDTCEVPPPVDPCLDNPCQNGGECTQVEVPPVEACLQAKGEPGCPESKACEEAVCAIDTYCCNNAWDVVCANCAQGQGGNCKELGTVCAGGLEASCSCSDGFDGDWCENNIDDCVDNACANGGVCVDGVAGYTCDCAKGYEGELCETNIDDCDPNPCANDGSCEDGVASFTCVCAEGFEGDICDDNIDDCVEDACANGGTCVDGVAGFTCECVEGFYGDTCEIPGMCNKEPCQNGGDCLDIVAEAAPSCIKGQDVSGCEESKLCEDTVCALDDYCCNGKWDGPCSNCAKGEEGYQGLDCSSVGYACLGGPIGFGCECVVGFEGDLCEENIDDCADNPCQNGGKCIDGVASYDCACQEGTSGTNCENIDNPCFLEPCQNDGTCDAIKTPLCQDGSCDDKNCVAAVCELDEFCCNNWDGLCSNCAAGEEGFGGIDCSGVIESCTEIGYQCTCLPGYDGVNCELEVEPPCSETSVVLNGKNCIAVPTDGVSELGAMTLEFWVRVDEFAWFFQSVLVDGLAMSGLDQAGFRLSFTNTGAYAKNLHYLESTPAGASKGFYGKNPFFDGFQEKTWTHVALVRNPQDDGVTKISVYVDGSYMIGPTFKELHKDPSNAEPLYIGCADKADGTTAHFFGAIDELRLSSVARYTKDFDPATILDADEDTVLLYHFDDPENQLLDASVNQFDGKWLGDALTTDGADPLVCE